MATVDAMRVANKEMKKQYKGINIDKIEVCFVVFMLLSVTMLMGWNRSEYPL